MENVLVVDRERSSCFLVKSILLGRGCGVSIAPTLKDARAKLRTGLFDAMVLDVGEPEQEIPLVHEALDLLPGFPIVSIFHEEPQSGPWVSLRRPIRVPALSDALRHALGRSPASWNRHNIDVPALVSCGAPFVNCRAAAISRHGILLTAGRDFERLRQFHEFFHDRMERDFEGRLEFPGGEEAFHAKIAYVEQAPDAKVRMVALALDEDRDWFGKLVVPEPAAPDPAVH